MRTSPASRALASRALATVGTTALLLGLTAAAPAGAGAAPADDLEVAFRAPQTLAEVDPRAAAVTVTVRAADCSSGCEVHRVGTLRMNQMRVLVGSRTTAPGPHTFTVADVLERTPGRSFAWHYELRRAGAVTASQDAELQVVPDDEAVYGPGWQRLADVTATETMIMRSTTPGAAATFPAQPAPRRVGVVAARGPRSGVLAVEVAGRVVQTVDLRAPGRRGRQVVVAVDVAAGAELRVVNASPASRTGQDVHLDGLVQAYVKAAPAARTSAGAASATPAPRAGATDAATGSAIGVLPSVPQRLSPGAPGPIALTVTAHAADCSRGCTVVGRTEADGSAGEEVLVERTAAGPQELAVSTSAAYGFSARLTEGGTTTAGTPTYQPAAVSEDALSYSDGWRPGRPGGATDGTLMRTGARGGGATYRVPGAFDGRPVGVVAGRGPGAGVLAVYADGWLVTTVDLAAATVRPREVVASVALPLRGRITLVNRTPAGRAGEIAVDGLLVLDEPDDWY